MERRPVRSSVLALTLAIAALAAACSSNPVPPPPGGDASNLPGDAASPDGAPPRTGPVTYWRDVAPILNAHCTQCHTANNIGPMTLDSYEQARMFAPLIKAQTADRRMPPWMPDTTNCRELRDPQVLTAEQIATLGAWADNGTPEGNRADYVAPMRADTARPLPPTGDLIAQPDADYTPTPRGLDDYHCFIVDPRLTEPRDMVGVRVLPGNPRIVHHVIVYEVRQSALAELQALDDAEPGPGYTCFGGPRINQQVRMAPAGSADLVDVNVQWLYGWAPGAIPTYFPTGTGLRLKPGSRLVMEVHYNVTTPNRGMSDRTRVDLYLAPREQMPNQGFWIPFANAGFSIPPNVGPADPAATTSSTVPVMALPLRAFGVGPHMHLRGRSLRMDALHADGSSECLINIPRWNFGWQQSYWYRSAYRPATTDQLRLTCTYDNTEANQPVIDGVRQPSRTLTWGESTNDEMCLNLLYVAL